MFEKVRVRFAPSPTGYLHVGGARTALYNYLFARQKQGDFILRIEDTDEERSSEESLRGMLEDLKWLGLEWNEGPHPETLKDMGPVGPYRQSQRQHIYKQVAEELIFKGKAYYCFMTDEEIEAQKEKQKSEGRPHAHLESPYADLPLVEAQKRKSAGEKATVRFKTKHLKKDYILTDLIRGEVKFPSDMVGDFVLLRSDGMPVYNFCCVVDDHLMKMSHVLRAEEHLPNTLRQMMIYEGMDWALPQFGHVSLVLDEDRQKLSKRRGAVACGQFKNEGYLPEAILNFVALLGWSHPEEKEIISLEEMVKTFSVERLNPSGAVFDRVKLKWMNAQHLRQKPNAELWALVNPFLAQSGVIVNQDPKWTSQALDVFKPKMEVLTDAIELFRPLSDAAFQVFPESKEVLSQPTAKAALTAWKSQLEQVGKDIMTEEDFLKVQDAVAAGAQVKGKNLFQPIRVAVIGKPQGTEVKILVPLLKVSSLIARAEKVLKEIG
ncbi:MAG: glutamate--tRNA ligase [Pseudobdellovibrionaceae bacterium]